MLQNYGKKKWEKGALPERERLSALSSEPTSIISEELQGRFTTCVLTSLPESTFMGCYKTAVFSFIFPFAYAIRTVPQGGSCPTRD